MDKKDKGLPETLKKAKEALELAHYKILEMSQVGAFEENEIDNFMRSRERIQEALTELNEFMEKDGEK